MDIKEKSEIILTEDTLENIKIMAPHLDKESQNQVYGMMFGIIKSMGKDVVAPEKKAG